MRYKEFLRFIFFCFVGGTSALIDMIVFNVFFFIGTPFIICRILAPCIAIIYNFSMNRNITFGGRGHAIRGQMARYAVVYSLAIGVNLVVSILVLWVLGENTLNANIAAVSGIIVSIPISYLGSLLWAFRKRPPKEEVIVS